MIESKGVLILERKDFVPKARDKDVEDLHVTDIAHSIKPYQRAAMVIVVDDGKMKIMKSRYPLRGERGDFFIGVDPAMGPDHSVTSKVHPDGRVEILKKK